MIFINEAFFILKVQCCRWNVKIVGLNEFAESVINSYINIDLIVFSDECKFCQRNNNTWKWYRRNDSTDDVFQKKEKVDKSIIIFSAIGIDFKRYLVIVDVSVDDVEYRRIFNESKIYARPSSCSL